MAVPKQKKTRAKARARRSQLKIKKSNLIPCTQCRELKLPHQACPHCGYYKGKQVIEVE